MTRLSSEPEHIVGSLKGRCWCAPKKIVVEHLSVTFLESLNISITDEPVTNFVYIHQTLSMCPRRHGTPRFPTEDPEI